MWGLYFCLDTWIQLYLWSCSFRFLVWLVALKKPFIFQKKGKQPLHLIRSWNHNSMSQKTTWNSLFSLIFYCFFPCEILQVFGFIQSLFWYLKDDTVTSSMAACIAKFYPNLLSSCSVRWLSGIQLCFENTYKVNSAMCGHLTSYCELNWLSLVYISVRVVHTCR